MILVGELSCGRGGLFGTLYYESVVEVGAVVARSLISAFRGLFSSHDNEIGASSALLQNSSLQQLNLRGNFFISFFF